MSRQAVAAVPHPWALGVGLALLLPQLVLAVVVVKIALVVGLAGFAMTLGFVRLASLGYRVLRERRPPLGRGALGLVGAVATVVGALLYGQVALAARGLGDEGFGGVIAPPAVIGLDLVVVLTLGVWIGGVVLLVGAVVGTFSARRTGA